MSYSPKPSSSEPALRHLCNYYLRVRSTSKCTSRARRPPADTAEKSGSRRPSAAFNSGPRPWRLRTRRLATWRYPPAATRALSAPAPSARPRGTLLRPRRPEPSPVTIPIPLGSRLQDVGFVSLNDRCWRTPQSHFYVFILTLAGGPRSLPRPSSRAAATRPSRPGAATVGSRRRLARGVSGREQGLRLWRLLDSWLSPCAAKSWKQSRPMEGGKRSGQAERKPHSGSCPNQPTLPFPEQSTRTLKRILVCLKLGQ